MKLITEREAAEMLRCSTEKIKRLRLQGKLAYIPGRPVLIDEADLLGYLETIKQRGAKEKTRTHKAELSADAWALKAVLKPKRASRTAKRSSDTR